MSFLWFVSSLVLILQLTTVKAALKNLRLPQEHIPYFLNNNPAQKEFCSNDPSCMYEKNTETKCWGYENDCDNKHRMLTPVCPGDAKGWVKNKEIQLEKFWKTADFGYIKEKKEELKTYCIPHEAGDSSVECVDHLRFCRVKNVYMDFSQSKIKTSNERYRENVFREGDLGGFCKLKEKEFHTEGDHKSPLQSWYGELQHFTSLPKRPIDSGMCEIVIDKPAYIMKLDAGVNMYHHFCDFVNLYMSQHLNNSFDMDVQLVMWDTSGMRYGDFFHDTWKAFSDYPIIPLSDWDGKKVCFKDAVFPLLPRMRYGHFYNMPLIPGCGKSSMYRAFSQHMVHRLNLSQEGPLEKKIRITLLSRSSKFRRILNQDEIVSALKQVEEYEVNVVDYNHKMPFLEQLQITHNSDIFMGMHGAGLTHLLFQPDWAVIFEIYNCDDTNCYKDLARLRGLEYMTWENNSKMEQEDEGHHPTLGAHKKFTNYSFQVTEFLRLVKKAAQYVRTHPAFRESRREKFTMQKEEL